MKKIAILSDIHGNLPALEAVVDDFKKKNIDEIINLGDNISGPLWPKETIRYLMKTDWIQIAGNHDRNLLTQDSDKLGASDKYAFHLLDKSEKDWLLELPDNFRTQEDLYLCHGTPSNNEVYLLETVETGRARLATIQEITNRITGIKSKIIICGHSHIQRIVELPGSILIINPGSVGLPAYFDEQPEYHIMESGSPHARYAILEFQDNINSIHLISVSYDYKCAVKQAIKNDRLDWAKGLETGFI